jgi:predicted metal-dependent phosphoesterase TrpH
MAQTRSDLHMHSHVSDGQLPPARVVQAAREGGLDVIALTDHDTAAGVEEARTAGASLGVRVIPGIEISTRWNEHELHILGYWIDPSSAPILAHQEVSVLRRVRRMEKMVIKLQEMGISISYEEVVAAAGADTQSIGRPHLARALLAGGHTRYYAEAFDRFISDQGPAFVAESFPTPEEAVALIHAAGGVAVWAHPPLELLVDEIQRFVGWGMDGVECFRPLNSAADTLLLERTARDLGLLTTGGSDWHGDWHGRLGSFSVPPAAVAPLLQREPTR